MSNFLIALLVSLSASAWTYNKFMKTTGSNTRNAVGGAAMAGVLAFLTMIVLLSFIN